MYVWEINVTRLNNEDVYLVTTVYQPTDEKLLATESISLCVCQTKIRYSMAKYQPSAKDLRSFEIRIGRPIRFERDWPIRKFSNRIGRACSFVLRKLSQAIQTINGT